ncbi:MAG: hypothetical protein ACO3Z6_13445 [Pseudomonadales bacterium]
MSFGVLLGVALSLTGGTAGLLGFAVALVIGYPVALVVGFPGYLLLQKLSVKSAFGYLLSGFLLSLCLVFVIVVFPMLDSEQFDVSSLLAQPRLTQIVLIVGGAAFNVMAFWMIARPDKEGASV